MISPAYEYKLKPTKKQMQDIESCLEICRSVYNWNHRERKDWIQSRKSPIDRCSIEKEYIIPVDKTFPNYYIQANNLAQAKKEYPYLNKVHSQVLQSTLQRLDKAWSHFFKVKGRGFPKFKNKSRFRSFVYPQIKTSAATRIQNSKFKIQNDCIFILRAARKLKSLQRRLKNKKKGHRIG